MPSTIPFNRGDVVLVPFPFTDLTAVKQRPAVVVSSSAANRVRPDVIVIAITSQIPQNLTTDEWPIPPPELAVWGLPKPSVVKPAKLFTIHQGLIKKSIGAVPASTMVGLLERIAAEFQTEDV
ncbi:MAG: type II toxin-antitoxin system PemK/MazF family toxin [Verrucomicrobia bacterium]|jgi:mRNA interferase MazF|nr:type II toxin-antitoxin system PemK/MazF family toxin [Verrucomicrobiota bacterium]